MLNLSNLDAKLQYIRNWQALQDFGITYFLVKVGKSRKEVGWLMEGRGGMGEVQGLEDMKNCLASRASSWTRPLQILKSHFAKSSATYSTARERMRKIASQTHATP